jgi:hypothetical protein
VGLHSDFDLWRKIEPRLCEERLFWSVKHPTLKTEIKLLLGVLDQLELPYAAEDVAARKGGNIMSLSMIAGADIGFSFQAIASFSSCRIASNFCSDAMKRRCRDRRARQRRPYLPSLSCYVNLIVPQFCW